MYINLLVEKWRSYSFRIWGFCLMPNHVHVVGVPETKDSLSKAIGATTVGYTQYFNDQYDRSGHLWQNRFYSCPMDEEHACRALCDVDLNPVRAGLIGNAWDYRWSSGGEHCGRSHRSGILHESWTILMRTSDYCAELGAFSDEPEVLTRIRECTHSGRPFGSAAFAEKVSKATGIEFGKRPRGRPRKGGEK